MSDKQFSGLKTSGLRGRSAIACSSQESPKPSVPTSVPAELADPIDTILVPRSQSPDAVLDSQPPTNLPIEVAHNNQHSNQDFIVKDSLKELSGVTDLAVSTRTNEKERYDELTQHISRIETTEVHLKGQAVLHMQPKSSRMSDTASLAAQKLVEAQPKLDSVTTSHTPGSAMALSTATSQQRLKELRAARSVAANSITEQRFIPISAGTENNHQSISPSRFANSRSRLDESLSHPSDASKSAVDSGSRKNLITYAKQRASRSKLPVASTSLPHGIHPKKGPLSLAENSKVDSTDQASKVAQKADPKVDEDGAWSISESPKTRSLQHRSDDRFVKQRPLVKDDQNSTRSRESKDSVPVTVIDDDGDDSLDSEDDDDDEDEDYRSKSLKTPAPGSRTTRASRQNGPLLELGRDTKKGPRRQNEGKLNDTVAHTGRPHGITTAQEQQQRDESFEDFENSMTYMHSGSVDHEIRTSHSQSPSNDVSHKLTEPTRDFLNEAYNRTEAEEGQKTSANIVAPNNLGSERDLVTPSSSKDGDTEENPVVLDDSGQEDISDNSSDVSVAHEDGEFGVKDRSPSLTNKESDSGIQTVHSNPLVPETVHRPETKVYHEKDLRTAERSAQMNKPHLIHFSQDGPKNQGILSDRKSNLHAARNHNPGSKAEAYQKQQPLKGSVEEAMMEILKLSSKGPQTFVRDEEVIVDDCVAPDQREPDGAYTKVASKVPPDESVLPQEVVSKPNKIPVTIIRPTSVKTSAILQDVPECSTKQRQMATVETASPHGKFEFSRPSLVDQAKRLSEKSANDKIKATFERSEQDKEGQKSTLKPDKYIKAVMTKNQHAVANGRPSLAASDGDIQSIAQSGIGKSIFTLVTDVNGGNRGTRGSTSLEAGQEEANLPEVPRGAFRTNVVDVRKGQFTNAFSNANTETSKSTNAKERKEMHLRKKNAALPSVSIVTSAMRNGIKRHSNADFTKPQKRAKLSGSNHPERSTSHLDGTEAGVPVLKLSQRRITSDGSPVRQEQEASYSQQQQESDDYPGHGMPLMHAPSRYFLKVRDDGLKGGSGSSEHETDNVLVTEESTLNDEFQDLARPKSSEQKVYSQAITHAGFDDSTSDESISQDTGTIDVEEDPFVGFTEQGIRESKQAQTQQTGQTGQTGQQSYFSRLKSEVRHKFEAELGVIEKQMDNEEVRTGEEDPDKTLVEEQDEDEEWSQISDEGTESLGPMDDYSKHLRTLEPHQRSVYEAIFRIGHELVSHLIDAETAIKDVVKNFHEECMTLVEQMEKSHKEKLDEHFRDTMRTKRELAKSFRLTAKQLEKGMGEVEKSGRDHRESIKGGNDGLSMLDNLLQRCN